jgi:hypothetical protein
MFVFLRPNSRVLDPFNLKTGLLPYRLVRQGSKASEQPCAELDFLLRQPSVEEQMTAGACRVFITFTAAGNTNIKQGLCLRE